MTDIAEAWTRRILVIVGVAVVWLAFFKLNAFAFSYLEHSSRAHWIFLPAALRVISVLLFEEAGVENTGNKRGHGSAGSTGLKMGQSC